MTSDNKPEARVSRIEIIDALRGLSVILMVCHHMLYNLVVFMSAPEWFFKNPVFDVLHPIFAGLFILLCGVSSQFSRSNIKRGLKTAACAMIVTAVTYYIGLPVWFGILHLLSFCMIIYGILRKLFDKASIWVYIVLLVISAVAGIFVNYNIFNIISADWFPPIPWIFVFLSGVKLGVLIRSNKLPALFYEYRIPFFPFVGRHSLLIYMAHQPILYSIVMLALRIGI